MGLVQYVSVAIYDNATDLTNAGFPTPKQGSLAIANDLMKIFQFNGSIWVSFGTLNVKRSSVLVDAKTVAKTKIYTTENVAQNFYPVLVAFRVGNVSGVLTPPTLSVGTNSPNYNNILQSTLLTTVLSTLGITSAQNMNAVSVPIPGNTDIYVNVSLGAGATTYNGYLEVIGFYDN